MFNILIFDSPMDIAVVVLIALLLFGGRKIPELMRGLGSGIREFREGMQSPSATAPPANTSQAPPAAHAPGEDKK